MQLPQLAPAGDCQEGLDKFDNFVDIYTFCNVDVNSETPFSKIDLKVSLR
jgi:hypothetical protein